MSKSTYIKPLSTMQAVFTSCFIVVGGLCFPANVGAITAGILPTPIEQNVG